jgi:hypothetical protein
VGPCEGPDWEGLLQADGQSSTRKGVALSFRTQWRCFVLSGYIPVPS